MRRATLAAVPLCLLVSAPARAEAPAHAGEPLDGAASASPPDALVDPSMRRSWREGAARAFVATTVDAGYLYLRPRVSLGWGQPFFQWVGLDANPIVVAGGLGAYGGLRVSHPIVDLRVGARYFAAFQHSYLEPATSYGRLELDDTRRRPTRYVTLESELTVSLPAGPGEVLALGSFSYVTNVPDSSFIFEETLRVIVAPPVVWRARGGYAFRLGASGQHSIGLVADALDVPKRDDSVTLRAGPVLRIALSRNVDVRGSFVVTLASPDRIGLVGGDFTELGVRWRTATGASGESRAQGERRGASASASAN